MGLGATSVVGLADARQRAADARKVLSAGADPIDAKRAQEAAQAADRIKSLTFEDCAKRYVESHSAGWRNAKHAAQWTATLTTYAYPTLGRLPVASIEIAHVMKVLQPIWAKKPETASRLRGRIEAVLDWASAGGYRGTDNPARWRGRLKSLLPPKTKVRAVRHHPALAYDAIGAFVAELRAQEGAAAAALEFLILTAARTGEVVGARWAEIDSNMALWTVPADRTKTGKEHRVPLSEPATAILRRLAKERRGDFVFPGGRKGAGLSTGAMLMLLERMGRGDITAHGFRSTFRDWCAERTAYPREVAEMALAHAVGDKVEAAYRRGDLFEKRVRLMRDWAEYCGTVARTGGAVVPIGAAKG